MAIVRTAGTEIIRCQHFTDVDGSADTKILIGEQHHIYTVLSIIIYAETLGASTSYSNVNLVGYDSKGGTTAQTMRLFRCFPQQYETFVWNDKFPINSLYLMRGYLFMNSDKKFCSKGCFTCCKWFF